MAQSSPEAVHLLPPARKRTRHGGRAEPDDGAQQGDVIERLSQLVKLLGGAVACHEQVGAVQRDDRRRLEHGRRKAHALDVGHLEAMRHERGLWRQSNRWRVLREALLLVGLARRALRAARVDEPLVQREQLAAAQREHDVARRDPLGCLCDAYGRHVDRKVVGSREREGRARLEGGARGLGVGVRAADKHAHVAGLGGVLVELGHRDERRARRRRARVRHERVLGERQAERAGGARRHKIVHRGATHPVQHGHVHAQFGARARARRAATAARLRVPHGDQVGVEVLVQHAAVAEHADGRVHRLRAVERAHAQSARARRGGE
mmetsp:Transcript_1612/g.4118  ORF Transcript_1612/g.4118 Transcript_1612/m.4118 type:complete len:322 (-) Transcript_1612:1287-2252(-)